jgi:hypothetical protein
LVGCLSSAVRKKKERPKKPKRQPRRRLRDRYGSAININIHY